jgi:hypothetical protein
MILKTGFLLYPNPAKKYINIALEMGFLGNYSIYTITGQLIQSDPLLDSATLLDISHLPNGMYLIRISGQGKITTLKFIKE